MRPSKFWEVVNENNLSMEMIAEKISEFKRSSVNYNISLHDPASQGVRYLWTVIYLMAKGMTDGMFDKLKRIKGRAVGQPISIIYNDEIVCLDYAQAIYELDFIEQYVKMDGMDILEVGAGYGRTCHAIISNYDIKSYTIADLDGCIALSHRYLREVLTEEQFDKITFLRVEQEELNSDFDLCLCIDAFSELDEGQAKHYVEYVNAHCRYFYLKTQLCRYNVNYFDNKDNETKTIYLNKGFDRISTSNNREVEGQVLKFLELYSPGPDWGGLGNSNAKPYMQYWQGMWGKNVY